jgi:predicted flavoprotein YhiN
VSGPIIHNVSVIAWEYLNSLGLSEWECEKYFCDNFSLELNIPLEVATKSLKKFFELSEENTQITIDLHWFRSLKEAKATSGWVDTNELDNNMQSKKEKDLYFIWEVVDVTGKTGWFNLQRAWSSAFVAAEHINKENKKDS